METTEKFRTDLNTSGSFLSVPSAYPSVKESVKNAIKFEIRPTYSSKTKEELELVFFPNRVLVDLGAVGEIDTNKIIADCDFFKENVSKYPQKIEEIVESLQANSQDGIVKAGKIAQEIGLTEEKAIKAGGGLFFLAVAVVAAVAVSGCVKKGDQMKPGDDSTIPKRP